MFLLSFRGSNSGFRPRADSSDSLFHDRWNRTYRASLSMGACSSPFEYSSSGSPKPNSSCCAFGVVAPSSVSEDATLLGCPFFFRQF